MFDQHIIVDGSLANVVERGDIVGFSFLARLPYYRGLGLSMVEDISITVDGEAISRDNIRFAVRGRSWTLDEMEKEYGDRWNFGEKASLTALKPGGLARGKHKLVLAERLRISYLPFVPVTTCEKEVDLE